MITLIEEKMNKKIEELNEKIEDLRKTEDISSSIHLNSEYVSQRGSLKMTKNGNTIVLTAYLNVLKNIPTQTTIINIDQPYRTRNTIVSSLVSGAYHVQYVSFETDGRIWIQKGITDTNLEVNLVWQI